MRGCRYQSHLLQVKTMIFDVELHCDKWKDCKTKKMEIGIKDTSQNMKMEWYIHGMTVTQVMVHLL